MLDIPHEGHFAETLCHAVVMHQDSRIVTTDFRYRLNQAHGRLNLLLSHFPGRFCAPFSMEPSSLITPGQAIPMNGASLSPSASASVIKPFSILTSRFTAPS